jgi:hypothetical protein
MLRFLMDDTQKHVHVLKYLNDKVNLKKVAITCALMVKYMFYLSWTKTVV